MSKLKHWMRNKLVGISDSKASKKDDQQWRLPILPEVRPRHLTPATSHESLLPNYNKQTAFFKNLPLDLRQHVYKAAFGGRTIHIELRFDHPTLALADPTHAHPHDNVHAGLDPENRRDRSIPPAWIWWGCVCHRNPALEACEDRCRSGSTPNTSCFLYPGVMPGKCFIGAMGWLLTCRQAYAEGIDVLYRTNAFFIDSPSPIDQFHRLLLPQRLALITALELSWDIFRPSTPSHPASEDWSTYNSFARAIVPAFLSLRTLYISVQVTSYISVQATHDACARLIENYERKLLGPIDEMVIRLGPKLQQCQIAPQYSLYKALKGRAESAGACIEAGGGHGSLRWERFWHPIKMESNQQYVDNTRGYWVRQGQYDTPLTIMNCFGT